MAVKVGDLYAQLELKKQGFDSAIDSAGKKFTTLGELAKAAGVVVIAAFAVAGAAAFKMAMDYDSAMDTIRTSTGKTGKELADLETDFKAVAKTVPDDLGKVAEAISEVSKRTGATGPALQRLTTQLLDLSRLTKTDLNTNLAAATRVFGDWSIASDDQAAALDRVFRASQTSGIGVDALMQKVVQFGAPLRTMGFSFDESVALMAKFEKEGVNSELVLGSMRIALGKFAKAGVPAREGLNGVIKKIQELGPSAEATALGMATFGARAGPDMVAAILEGRFAIDDYMAAIQGGTDTITGAATATADFPETIGKLVNAITVEVGSRLMPALASVSQFFLDAMPTIIAAVTGVFEGMGQIVGAFAPVMDVVIAMGQQVANFLGQGNNFKDLMIAIGLIVATVVVPPFVAWAAATVIALAPILAIGAAVFALIAVLDNLGLLQPIIEAVTKAIGDAFNWVAKTVMPPLVAAFSVVADNALPAIKRGFEVLSDVVKKVMDAIGPLIDLTFKAIGFVIDTYRPVIQFISDVVFPAMLTAAQLLQTGIQVAWDLIAGIISGAVTTIQGAVNLISQAWNGLIAVFKGVGDAITGSIRGALNILIDIVNSMIDALNGIQIHIPGIEVAGMKFGQFDWGGLGLGRLPHLAQGIRNFRGGLAVVGERGPEVVSMPSGASVTPNGGGAPVTLYATFNVTKDQTPEEFARDSLLALKREVDRQGIALVPA